MDAFVKTPQVHIIGKIQSASQFFSSSLYAKYSFKSGDSWTLIQGQPSGETFQFESDFGDEISFEHPFDLSYAAKSIRGWPKLLLEVWEIDNSGRNSIAGYGQMTIPSCPGEYELDIHCWRPKAGLFDRMIGARPELIHKDAIVSSDNRFGFKCESSGKVKIQVSVLLKDFHFHGVMTKQNQGNDLYLQNFKKKT